MSDALAKAREAKRVLAEERAQAERSRMQIRVQELRNWLQTNTDKRPGTIESVQMLLRTYERALALEEAASETEAQQTAQRKEQPMLYTDMYPKEGHPNEVAPLVPGKAEAMIKARHPVHLVSLDEGAFRVVWGLVEEQAEHRFPTRETMPAADALLRAVGSFRHSFVEQSGNGSPEAPETALEDAGPASHELFTGERPRKLKVKRIRNRQAVEEEVEVPRRTMVRKPAEETSTPDLTNDAKRILRALKNVASKNGGPQGKSDLIASCGLADEDDWLPAIRELLRAKLIVQTGAKRGAKYEVAK